MNIFECKGVKSSLLLLLIVGCLFSSGCTALQEAQQRRMARREKAREVDMPLQWIKSISEGMTAAAQMGKPVMMDFYTDW